MFSLSMIRNFLSYVVYVCSMRMCVKVDWKFGDPSAVQKAIIARKLHRVCVILSRQSCLQIPTVPPLPRNHLKTLRKHLLKWNLNQ